MILVLEAMAQNPAEELYQQQIDSLILQQDSLLSSTHVRRRIVTHHNTYTIHHKPKKFFRRLADVFAPGKEDSTQVNNVIQEEYTDTIDEAYNPVDTIASMLANIQNKVFQTRQETRRPWTAASTACALPAAGSASVSTSCWRPLRQMNRKLQRPSTCTNRISGNRRPGPWPPSPYWQFCWY